MKIGREEAERIARISRQLLGLYAAEASTRCRIGDLLQRVLEHESERLAGKPLPVRLRVNSDTEVRAVESELRHALVNLLHNALRALPQLQPWLVPHSVQTPHAPARITLSLPHTEHVISIKMLPSASRTRSA